jgi:DMSO/TMAO reductase YedYZ molybdopterin-dependent catalytic subunit
MALQGGSMLSTLMSCASETDGNPLEGGTYLRNIPFVDEGSRPLSQLYGQGLDTRRNFDLSTLREDKLINPTEDFFVRGGTADLPESSQPWRVNLKPGNNPTKSVTVDELIPESAPMGAYMVECAGNDLYSHFGLMGVAEWNGFPLADILRKWNFPSDRLIKITGFDKYSVTSQHSTLGASWVFTFEQLEKSGAFLANKMNQAAIPIIHGRPIRLIIPNWFACTHFKWLTEISVVPDAEPATSHMREFATRTHQYSDAKLARDFIPAEIDFTAMPIRVEQWRVRGKIVYVVAGVAWGGEKTPKSLLIRFSSKSDYTPVESFRREPSQPWSLWSYVWQAPKPGKYRIRLRVGDRGIRARRLDLGYYTRRVEITEAT